MKKYFLSFCLLFSCALMFGQIKVDQKVEAKKEMKKSCCSKSAKKSCASKAECSTEKCLGAKVEVIEGKLVISEVMDESPAAKAGLRAGDAISAINTKTVSSTDRLNDELKSSMEDENVKLTVNRDGETMDMDVKMYSQEKSMKKSCAKGEKKAGCCSKKKS